MNDKGRLQFQCGLRCWRRSGFMRSIIDELFGFMHRLFLESMLCVSIWQVLGYTFHRICLSVIFRGCSERFAYFCVLRGIFFECERPGHLQKSLFPMIYISDALSGYLSHRQSCQNCMLGTFRMSQGARTARVFRSQGGRTS